MDIILYNNLFVVFPTDCGHKKIILIHILETLLLVCNIIKWQD